MPICEICGTSYTPTPKALDCPQCAAKLARLVSAKPTPTSRPATSKPAPVSRPAASRPAAAGKPPTASKKPAPAPAKAASAARPAAARAPAARAHGARHARPSPELLEHGPKPAFDQATKIGFLVTLGLALVVGIVVFFVARNKAAEKRVQEAREKDVQSLFQQLSSLDVHDPVAAENILKAAGEKESLWMNHDLAGQIQSLVGRARVGLTTMQEQRETLARFTDLEKELEKGDLTADRLRNLRRQLDESEAELAKSGTDFVARFALARKKADDAYAPRLLDEAKSTVETSGVRPGLIRYNTVEDEIKGMLDRAYFQKNQEQQDFYTPLYKRAIEESDALANQLFESEGERLDWVDCLVAPQAGNWNASAAKGFSYEVKENGLHLVGPDADAGKLAVISIGDREQWRHFQLDFEVYVDKGDIELYLRLGRSPNANTLSYPLRTEGPDWNLKAGRKYAARVTVVASKFSVRFVGEDIDTPSPFEETVNWSMNRKGAIGLVVSPETRARFTRFQVRELR